MEQAPVPEPTQDQKNVFYPFSQLVSARVDELKPETLQK